MASAERPVSDPAPRPAPRCTVAERKHRTLLLQQAIATGEDPGAAARRLVREWGLVPRKTARRYLRLAFASWSADRTLAASASLDSALATRRLILRCAMAADDFTAALKAQDGIERLLGVGEAAGVVRAELDAAFADVREVLVRHVTDRAVRARIGRDLLDLASNGAAPVESVHRNGVGLNGTNGMAH